MDKPVSYPAAVALALLTVYLIWGSTYLGIALALQGGFSPFWLGATRFLLAGGLMFAVLRWRGVPMPTPAQWRNGAVMGLLLLVIGNGMVNYAEQTVSSGLTAVAVASSAIWMGVFAFLRGERPSALEWLGIVIGFVGVVLLNAQSLMRQDGQASATAAGMVALLLASVSWAYGSIWSRGRDLPSPFMTAAVQMLCGGAMMLGVALLRGEQITGPTATGLAAWGYLVLFGSILGFSAYVWLLHNVRPALASSYAYVNPAIAVLLGMGIAGERMDMATLLPMGIILAGVVVITLAKALGVRR